MSSRTREGEPLSPLAAERMAKPRRRKKRPEGYGPDISKKVVPDMNDPEPERADLYFSTLVQRLIMYINRRRKYDKSRFNYSTRMSWANISRATGIHYDSLMNYFVRRNQPISIALLDKVLFATKISILDLIDNVELLKSVESMTNEERAMFRISMRNFLDKLSAIEDNTTVSPDSQAQTSGDED